MRTTSLKFSSLREANLRRLPLFKNARGETAHSQPDGSDWSDSDWLMAVTGELGEFANLRKKVLRGDLSMEDAKQDLADELADVVIYLDILAYRLGIDLDEAIVSKFNRVSERVGCDVKLHYPMDIYDVTVEIEPAPSVATFVDWQDNFVAAIDARINARVDEQIKAALAKVSVLDAEALETEAVRRGFYGNHKVGLFSRGCRTVWARSTDEARRLLGDGQGEVVFLNTRLDDVLVPNPLGGGGVVQAHPLNPIPPEHLRYVGPLLPDGSIPQS